MINVLRRTAGLLAAVAVIGGAGAGAAGAATPAEQGAGHSATTIGTRTWIDPWCWWGGGFDWHHYRFCDDNFWHGSHFSDWQRFDQHHRGYDYGWHR
ncbi:hypothetical protein [Nocardia africana]|uniref:Pili structural subunit n=1 Tax=Nocardia africana TaxID=134964 RepID=A0ABW6NDZ9_9NOCA